MNEKSTIDEYRDGDEAEINELFTFIFEEDRDLRAWAWKFKDSPFDARPLIVLARVDGKIVGQYCCTVHPWKYEDRSLKIAQVVDNMIRKEFQGGTTGLQVKMFRRMEEHFRAQGIALAYGFPNHAAYVFGKRFTKYVDLIEIENLFKILRWRPVLRKVAGMALLIPVLDRLGRVMIRYALSRRIKPLEKVEFTRVDSLDRRVDGLWRIVRQRYNICVERDHQFLRWRYCDKPDTRYRFLQAERGSELIGLIVTRFLDRPDDRVGFIMDCLAVDEPGLVEGLVNRALLSLFLDRVDFVLVRMAQQDPMNRVFRKLGFSSREGIWDSRVVHGIYSPEVEESFVRDGANWLISFGDGDSL